MDARVVMIAGGLLLLAGCGRHEAAASTTSAPLPVTTATTPPTTPVSTPSVTPTRSVTPSAGAACTVDQLRVSPFVEGTAQDAFVTLTVTDAGAACGLDGNFGVAGYLGGTEVFGSAGATGAATPIRLGAEQHLTFQVSFVATDSCPRIDTLRVTPPGQPAYVAVPLGQTVHACAGATLSPPQGP